ncbi:MULTISPECIES: carbohydrate ABC transporter permease [unclassified Curtobacterium]|uniref:carbohydrate ABC transporter permease n=1 Tax=unclassified Curtobacterium TaxID=257496 RepID=UPI000A9C7295|nr:MULTISPECIES: sugar ABC transporter permease [unclassified Curtobacterium]WIB00293.1 sugar ABC transporter permease [Curtobacterium sp. MCBA15_012]
MTTNATGLRDPGRASRPDRDGPRDRRRTPATWLRRGGLSTLVFALPLILVFGLFSWWPIVRATVMSFQQTNLVTAPTFVGWDNFVNVLHDPLLPTAMGNTVWFAVLALVFGYPLPLVMAVLMSELRRAKGFFSALVYLPVVVPPVVAVLLWKFFYDGSATGVFNTILGFVGIPPQPWLQNAGTAMPSLVLEATWAAAGGTVIIYLAALLSVPPELYDAAEVDGARVWRKIWHVTLPQLRGVLFVTLILQVIGTAQVFLEPYLFTGGGPNNSTTTILLMIYDYAFANSTGGDYGSATALSIMLAVVLAALSILYFRLTKKWSV